MKTRLTTRNKQIHSDWTIMQTYYEQDETFRLIVADKYSNDSINFQLEEKDIERIKKTICPELEELKIKAQQFDAIAKIINAIEATRLLFEAEESNNELIYIMIYTGKMKITIDDIELELKKNKNYIVKRESELTIEVYSRHYLDRVAFATITDC